MGVPGTASSILGLMLAAALLGGCAGILPRAPEAPTATYLLAPDRPPGDRDLGLGGAGVSGPTLLVSRPEAAAGYDSRRMAYLEQDYRLDTFAGSEWVDAPAAMLGPLLVRVLKDRAAFGAVSEDGRGIRADLRLDTVIESLYQDFRTRPSQARVALRVRLVDPDGQRILATRVFADAEPAPSDDPYGGVVAANRALARLLPRIADLAAETAAGFQAGAPKAEPGR